VEVGSAAVELGSSTILQPEVTETNRCLLNMGPPLYYIQFPSSGLLSINSRNGGKRSTDNTITRHVEIKLKDDGE